LLNGKVRDLAGGSSCNYSGAPAKNGVGSPAPCEVSADGTARFRNQGCEGMEKKECESE